jgi:DNA-binding NarL/FixJ family response regulator
MAMTQPKSNKLGILMIGFSPVVRAGLQAILTKDKRLELIGDAPDGYDALLYIKRLHDWGQTINVRPTETRNSGLDGVLATRVIKDEFPEIAILVLTDNLNDTYVIDGHAQFSTSSLSKGTHAIMATYGGNDNLDGCNSSAVSQVVK